MLLVLVSFWGPAHFQGRTAVSFRQGNILNFEPNNEGLVKIRWFSFSFRGDFRLVAISFQGSKGVDHLEKWGNSNNDLNTFRIFSDTGIWDVLVERLISEAPQWNSVAQSSSLLLQHFSNFSKSKEQNESWNHTHETFASNCPLISMEVAKCFGRVARKVAVVSRWPWAIHGATCHAKPWDEVMFVQCFARCQSRWTMPKFVTNIVCGTSVWSCTFRRLVLKVTSCIITNQDSSPIVPHVVPLFHLDCHAVNQTRTIALPLHHSFFDPYNWWNCLCHFEGRL